MKPKNEPSTIQNRRFHVLSIAYSKDGDRKSINDFRAEEEKVEREYEKKQSEIEQNQTKENDQSTNTASDEESDKVRDIRCKILDAAIPFVVQHGWSREAITHGAESINYPGIAHGLFPKGSIELINHFYVKCNRETIERLRDEKIEDHTEFLVKALKTRIELVIPYRDTWPQAIAKLALPHNAATSLAQMLTFVDDVCYLTGQDSADISWYARRVGLASVLKTSEVYMLQDKSPNCENTWKFLRHRLDEGKAILAFLNDSEQKTKNITNTLGSAFTTARNIIGFNCDKK